MAEIATRLSWPRLPWLVLPALLVSLFVAEPSAFAAPKRKRQDYYGAPPPSSRPLLWIPRVLLFPPWLVSEYVLRKPMGALVRTAEREEWVPRLEELFTFGDRRQYLLRVSDAHAKSWASNLGVAVRRCYLSDDIINERAAALGVAKAEVIAARLPDPGATMAGDFGEILVYFYQGASELPAVALGPKKWRLKQDRTKPAPHSDVLHFVLPSWPRSSNKDLLLCSEVKTKSTDGGSTPIQSAIADSEKDRTSRLARTLVWLRERALLEPLGDVQIQHLERFINATDHPPAMKRFRALGRRNSARYCRPGGRRVRSVSERSKLPWPRQRQLLSLSRARW